jgi:hypothetical protein
VTYTLPRPFAGYDAGTALRDVTLTEARALECNRCGDCCNGLSDSVKRDEATGFPLFTWGSEFPEDLYAGRYGRPLLTPLVMGDGGIVPGERFDEDADGKPYTAFQCAFLETTDQDETTCGLYGKDHDPADLATLRQRNCGEFPVFGLDVAGTIVDGNAFVPPTGALPRCTWHGIRVVGPFQETPYWRDRWEQQQNGDPVEPVARIEYVLKG